MSQLYNAFHCEIGKTSIKLPAVGLGCMSLASGVDRKVDDENSLKLLKKALDIGCNFLGTANIYGKGHSEKIISKVLKGRRKDVFLASKFDVDHSSSIAVANGDPEYAKKCCAESLERLGTDYIDLYCIYRLAKDTPIEPTIAALAELVKEGKVKHLGLSECSATTIQRAHKTHSITAVKREYSSWFLDIEKNDVVATCRELDISVVAFSPIGRGFLAGQIKSFDEFDADDNSRNYPIFQGENFARKIKLVDKIKEIAGKEGVTSAQLCLAWLLSQGQTIFVIPGTLKERYLLDNFAAGQIQLIQRILHKFFTLLKFQISGDRYDSTLMKVVDHPNQ